MMKPGAYVLCRPINAGPAQHQFLVLVPSKPEALKGFTKSIGGQQICVMGAYNVAGFLRADLFAASDVNSLEVKMRAPTDKTVQSSKIELQACLIDTEDPFLECMARSYARYRSLEGSKSEIRYPVGKGLITSIAAQLSRKNYNSNSWAQSLLYWAQMVFVPGKSIRDFDGLDIGNSRVIPKRYFLP